MLSEPITIPGIAGPVVVDSNVWTGRHNVSVAGTVARRTGRRTVALPTAAGGSVEAKVRSSLFDPFPTVEVAGTKHRAGPDLPIGLRILMVLPIGLVLVGGFLGAVCGLGAVFANIAIARTGMPVLTKVLSMLGTAGGAALLWFVIAGTIFTTVNG